MARKVYWHCTFLADSARVRVLVCQGIRIVWGRDGSHFVSNSPNVTINPVNEEERVAKQDYEQKYTDPELREEIKEEIKASDKGGKKGQWSARKSQLLTQEYEKRGGGYQGEKDPSQRNLEKWTEEEWQTKEGDAQARQEDGETKRYLPKKAWENMSEEEKEETERKKREGSKQGQQYVSNTDEAKKARKSARDLPLNGYDLLSVEEVEKKLKGLSKDDIEAVRSYEKNHKNRKTLLERIDSKL
jgi:hypothetical protein